MIVTVPEAGVVVGTNRDGTPVLLPAVGARPIRIGVLAFPPLLLAFRLLGVGCEVTVLTAEPRRWVFPVPDRRLHVTAERSWPVNRPAPPGSGAGPQVLISDLPVPPTRQVGDQPWCTVIHCAPRAPAADFWAGVDAVLTRGNGDDLAMVVGRRTVPFRPVLAPAEAPLVR
jgi:hypothetical protein